MSEQPKPEDQLFPVGRKRAAQESRPFVPTPCCPCGRALDFCDCGELVCFAPGHARHICEGVAGAA